MMQVLEVPRAAISMKFNCQKDEHVDQMLLGIFVENKLSVGFVDESSYVRYILQLCPSEESALA